MRFWACLIAVVAATGCLVWYFQASLPQLFQPPSQPTDDWTTFENWVAQDPSRGRELDAFAAVLKSNGVHDVLPVWTLLRSDAARFADCDSPPFILPPREQWASIVPALRLVRDEVEPAVGKVAVVSSFRTEAFNACAGGAPASRHMQFAALDLVPLEQTDAKVTFAKLCAAWRKAGPESRWGLGAYFDPSRPSANRVARFHVDGTGWRSWGYDYSGGSSGCNLLE